MVRTEAGAQQTVAKFAIALVLVLIPLNACAATSSAKAPCYDGWTFSKDGESRLIELSEKARLALKNALGAERKLICVHKLGDGALLAVNYERGGLFSSLGRYATRFALLDDSTVVLGEENIII